MEKLAIILPVVLIIFIIVLILKLNKTVDESDKLNFMKNEIVYYKKLSELLQKQTSLYKDIVAMNEEVISKQKEEIILYKQITK